MKLPTVVQKQLLIALLIKRCCENMQQANMRTPISKCNFNKVAMQLYWNHTSAWCFLANVLHIFSMSFPESTSGGLLLIVSMEFFCLSTSCKGFDLFAFTKEKYKLYDSFFYIKSKSNIAHSIQKIYHIPLFQNLYHLSQLLLHRPPLQKIKKLKNKKNKKKWICEFQLKFGRVILSYSLTCYW